MRVKIEKLIYGGLGLARTGSGKVIMVKKAVPGDVLDVSETEKKKNHSFAKIKNIASASEKRTTPRCKHFQSCGGCDHQNISYPDQVMIKQDIFSETLQRAGINTEIMPILKSDNELFYRNSIRFEFVIDSENRLSLTRHNFLNPSEKVPIEECLLQSEKSNELLRKIKKLINEEVKVKSSFWQIKIREGKKTEELMLELITSDEDLPAKDAMVRLAKDFGINSLYHTVAPNRSLKHLKRKLLFGSAIIHEQVGKFKFQISPESFFQTNSLGAFTLYETIKQHAKLDMKQTVLDLYCGTGTIGIYLSTLAKEVVGVELVQKAVNDAKDNAKLNMIGNIAFETDDAGSYLKKTKKSFDVVIIDPPRAGLDKKTKQLLQSKKFKKIIYASCNPTTLARDLRELSSCYQIIKAQPVDMFPQTHHIEAVASLSLKK